MGLVPWTHYPSLRRRKKKLTASTLHVAVGAVATAEAGRSLPLGASRLPLGGVAVAAVGARALASNGTRGASGLRMGGRLVGAKVESTKRAEKAAVGARSADRTGGRRQVGGGKRGGLVDTSIVIAEAGPRVARLGNVPDAVHGRQVARRGCGRARAEGPQIGEALGSAKVGKAISIGASRKLKGRTLAAHGMGVVGASAPGLSISGEVEGGCPAEALLVVVQADSGRVDLGCG